MIFWSSLSRGLSLSLASHTSFSGIVSDLIISSLQSHQSEYSVSSRKIFSLCRRKGVHLISLWVEEIFVFSTLQKAEIERRKLSHIQNSPDQLSNTKKAQFCVLSSLYQSLFFFFFFLLSQDIKRKTQFIKCPEPQFSSRFLKIFLCTTC